MKNVLANKKVSFCIGILVVLLAVATGIGLYATSSDSEPFFQTTAPQERNDNTDLTENINLVSSIDSETKKEITTRSSQRLNNSMNFTLSEKDVQLWSTPLKNVIELFDEKEEISVTLRPMSTITDFYYEDYEKDSLEAYANEGKQTETAHVSDLSNYPLDPKTAATISPGNTEKPVYKIIVINHTDIDKSLTECPIVYFETDLSFDTTLSNIRYSDIDLKISTPDDILNALGTPYEEFYTDQKDEPELEWIFQNDTGNISILFNRLNKVISISFDALYDNTPIDLGNASDLAGITLKSAPVSWEPTISIQKQDIILGGSRLSDLEELGIAFTADLDQISNSNEITVRTANDNCLFTAKCVRNEPISNGIIYAVSIEDSTNDICGLSSGTTLDDVMTTLGQPIKRYDNWVSWQNRNDISLHVDALIENNIVTQISISKE